MNRSPPAMVHVGRPPAPYGARRPARFDSIEDLARVARRRLPQGALGYLDGGGEDEYTLRRNRAAFDTFELVPRVHDVADVDTATTLLGARIPVPIALTLVGAPRLVHHEGELAVARAAGHAGLPYAISTLATVPLERVAHEASGPLWCGAGRVSSSRPAWSPTSRRCRPSSRARRAVAFYDVIWNGARLFSLALGGVIAELFGVRLLYAGGAGLLFAAAAVGLGARADPTGELRAPIPPGGP